MGEITEIGRRLYHKEVSAAKPGKAATERAGVTAEYPREIHGNG